MKNKFIVLFFSFILVLSLSACGNASLSEFKSDMDTFIVDITKVDTQMNTIDPDSDDAVKEMLECLSALDVTFKSLAEIGVPNEFIAIEDLADEASEYMTLSLQTYEEAFEDPDAYNEAKGDAALLYLQRALVRKEYIAIILQGGTPEGDGVIITYESIEDEEPISIGDTSNSETTTSNN